jgi:o-succinylbenzoate---CoA ligase
MNFKSVSSLKLNNRVLENDSLNRYAKSQLADPGVAAWQKSMYGFLVEWLDEKEYVIVKTSGSSGDPKSIRISKQYMVNSALMTGQFLNLCNGDKALMCLSADFIAGKMMLVRAMVLGLKLKATEPSGNPLKHIHEKFDFAAMVPMQVYQIIQDAEGVEKLNAVKNLIIGGAPVRENLRKMIKWLSNRTFSTYGMTETVTHIAMERLNGRNADGRLHPLPGVEISADGFGRLIIHAPDIAAMTVETNDLAEIHNEGSFKILGRFDHIINSGGIKIIPEVTEKKIESFIRERFVVSSLHDEKLGEKVVLVIEDMPWPAEKINRLKKRLREKLHKTENPKEVIFMATLPETAGRKIDRLEIKNILSGT